MGFSLYEFRDLDLMLAMEDGEPISSVELADSLGIDSARAVGTRMGYMRSHGIFDFDEKERLWSLARGGARVLKARQQANTNGALKIPDAALIDAMAHITARYRKGDDLHATLLRREFLFGTKKRR